jgi:hypothetical protein
MGHSDADPPPGYPESVAQAQGQAAAHSAEQSRAERVMRALAQAYPGSVANVRFLNGDWAADVGGKVFYFAESRLLPESLRTAAAEYSPQPFYQYRAGMPQWSEPSDEEAERMKNAADSRQQNPPKRSQHFFDALWRANTRSESYERVKTMKFLGHSVLVHYSIMEELALIEERILKAASAKPEVKRWIDGLGSITGWNWRSIADTQSRSFHAYGAAIDLLPKSRAGLETYWLWTREYNKEWWAVPYSKRLHPPAEVLEAFEAYGFIWGGKWAFYDTMHFEYRPEILRLSGIEYERAW